MPIMLVGLSMLLTTGTVDGGAYGTTPPTPAATVEIAVEGLSNAVRIDLDAFGTPSIKADHRDDAYAALGFMHARDRLGTASCK